MRSMLLSIMFCMISSASWGENVSWADLVENPGDGLVYKKFRGVPFTGVVMAAADDLLPPAVTQSDKAGVSSDTNPRSNRDISGAYSCVNLRDRKTGKFIWDVTKVRFMLLDENRFLLLPTTDGSHGIIPATNVWNDGSYSIAYRSIAQIAGDDPIYIDVFFHNDQDIELKFTSNNLNINGFMNCSKIPEVLDSISLEEVFQTFLQ